MVERFKRIRQLTEDLCAGLSAEDMVIQPMEDASPTKWHLGHTTWFFETLVLPQAIPGFKPYHDDFSFLFNSYYESVGQRILRTNRGLLSQPPLDRVIAYRHHINDKVIKALESGVEPQTHKLVELGLNHEQQHQELLLTDIKYTLGNQPLFPSLTQIAPKSEGASSMEWIKIEEGIHHIGYDCNDFSYDNESPQHRTFLHQTAIASRTVTNGEYLNFIQHGGYQNALLWLSDGYAWIQEHKINSPLYWHFHKDQWWEYRLDGLHLLDLNLPVTHISYFEAEAYAQWAGYRLPLESEWEVAAQQNKLDEGTWLDQGIYHPEQVGNHFAGNGWEWTGSSYLPYPGYQKEDGALGEYNGKFMINQMVLRGGSCATPKDHYRNTYRNFFQTDKRWQFTAIRLAKRIN